MRTSASNFNTIPSFGEISWAMGNKIGNLPKLTYWRQTPQKICHCRNPIHSRLGYICSGLDTAVVATVISR